MKKAGIIGAMEMEVALIKEQMQNLSVVRKAGMEFCEGKLNGMGVVVVRSGVGKVNAAVCTQILADRFGVDCVINTGVAGSLDARINIGDFVVSTDVMHHDVDATLFGYAPGEVPQLGVVSFPADEALTEETKAACRAAAPDREVFSGRVISGDQFIVSREKKGDLKKAFNGMCTEMEGAAIAQTAWLNHLPFVILRAISDKADESAYEEYPVFEEKAARSCAGIIRELAGRLAKTGESGEAGSGE